MVARWLVAAGIAVALGGSLTTPAAAEGAVGDYLVVFEDATADRAGGPGIPGLAWATANRHGGRVGHTFQSVVRGYAASMSESAARRVAADPNVARVERDGVVRAAGRQLDPPSWGLDRLDQANRPLDASYTYRTGGSAVHAYVVDSGIRPTHTDFGNRARLGVNTAGGGDTDCHGHGTNVAGTIGGTRHGVAKDVRLVGVKVLNCDGSGSVAGVIAGLDWVARNAIRPAVANISLEVSGSHALLESAVRGLVAAGVTTVVAAGNSGVNACNTTPARVTEAITVSASDRDDRRPAFANFGTCVDLFAPGVSITSAWSSGDTATNTATGTSSAAAHVAGIAAQWLSLRPNAKPAEIATRLRGHAAVGKVVNPGTGSPNYLATVPTYVIPVVSQPVTAAGVVGEQFTLAPRVFGGTPPYTWSATGLPPGVSLDPATGRYSGTPGAVGRHTVRATVTDSAARSDTATVDLVTRLPGAVLNQAVVQPGFESGPGPQPWSVTPGVLGQTLQPARTGAASAWLGGTGFANRDTLSQSVAIPVGNAAHTLSFWVRVETSEWPIGSGPGDTPGAVAYKPNPEGPLPWPKPWPCPCPPPEPWGPVPDPWDVLLVELETFRPYPEPWVALDVISHFDARSGYQLRTYDVSAYAGTSVTLRLTSVEDTGATTSFVIDDVTVNTT